MIGQSMQNQNDRQHHPLRGDGFRQVLKKVRFRFGQSLQRTNIEDISTTIQGRDVCPDKLCVDANEFAPPIAVKELLGESSEEHTSELQSLMRTSSAVFCL